MFSILFVLFEFNTSSDIPAKERTELQHCLFGGRFSLRSSSSLRSRYVLDLCSEVTIVLSLVLVREHPLPSLSKAVAFFCSTH